MNMKKILQKYRELILYVIFGVATTVVNLAVFYLLCGLLGDERYLIANVIAWVAGVIFAYITNKLFVFESRSWAPAVLLRESLEFFAARLFSLGVEEAGLILLIQYCRFDSILWHIGHFTVTGPKIAKLILAVVVVLLNYIFSKLLIFKKPSAARPDPEKTEEK